MSLSFHLPTKIDGVPQHDDRVLFEFLILEGAQAGLSWETILRKRAAFRRAFDQFDVRAVARYDRRKREALLADAGIVRNRLKIEAAVQFLEGGGKRAIITSPECLLRSLRGECGTTIERE